MRAVLLAFACAGCIPAVPFVVGETAETLRPREVSAAIYGGGGAFTGTGTSHDCCGGVMGRVRVGIGHAQEVGVEGGAYITGGGAWGTAKLAWKLQARQHLAIVGGVGTTFLGGVVALGGDAGLIVSTNRLAASSLQLYAGLRVTMMLQTNAQISDGGGVLSGGVLFAPTERLRVALELGAVGGGGHQTATALAEGNAGWFGGYGAALLSYAWTR